MQHSSAPVVVYVDMLSAEQSGDPQSEGFQTSTRSAVDESTGYCPVQLLSAFSLLLAGHGRCVNMSMMLGDRHYALRQLSAAHTINDSELRFIAAKLFAYFDDESAPVPTGLHA